MTLREWEEKRRLGHRVTILKAVAHPVRLCIIAALAAAPRHVNALAEELEVPQAIVSQQLRILRMSRVVDVERKSGLAVYRLAEVHLRTLLRCMDRCCAAEEPGRAAGRSA